MEYGKNLDKVYGALDTAAGFLAKDIDGELMERGTDAEYAQGLVILAGELMEAIQHLSTDIEDFYRN